MEQKTKLLIIIGIILLLIFLWWTRYQPIGEIGLADKNPVVMNRLTGKIWVITPAGAGELRWQDGLVRKSQ